MAGPSLKSAIVIVRTLKALGHDAVLAGGCVRDRVMGREPKDFDIATSARPEQVAASFPKTEAVGAAFGVTLVIHDGSAYEVATYRSDGPYVDGRRPESVRFTSPEEDAARRDFTVNGLFLDPDLDEIHDFVDGRADIDRRLIRAIGEPAARFAEDKLRVLRAIRFACQLDFQIDPTTWAALKAQASDLGDLAWERIHAELTKILCSPAPRRGLELLDEAGLVQSLLPELLPMKGCTQPPEFHPEGDVWEHTLQVLSHLRSPSPSLAWAALLHDVAKPATRTHAEGDRIRFNGHEGLGADMARETAKRLKFSSELSERVSTLVADHLRLNPIKEMKVSTLKRLLRRDDIQDLLELVRADCLGSHADLGIYDYALSKKAWFEASDSAASMRPEPLLDGADLIVMGYQPGKIFKEILNAVEDEQLEGRMRTKDEAREFVKSKYPA